MHSHPYPHISAYSSAHRILQLHQLMHISHCTSLITHHQLVPTHPTIILNSHHQYHLCPLHSLLTHSPVGLLLPWPRGAFCSLCSALVFLPLSLAYLPQLLLPYPISSNKLCPSPSPIVAHSSSPPATTLLLPSIFLHFITSCTPHYRLTFVHHPQHPISPTLFTTTSPTFTLPISHQYPITYNPPTQLIPYDHPLHLYTSSPILPHAQCTHQHTLTLWSITPTCTLPTSVPQTLAYPYFYVRFYVPNLTPPIPWSYRIPCLSYFCLSLFLILLTLCPSPIII